MQTVSQLKQLGFSIGPSPRAIDCTEVRASTAFHFFNPRFVDDAAQLVDSLREAAILEDGQYGVIIAGKFGDADPLPFVLLDAAQVEAVRAAHVSYTQAKAERDEATRRVGEAGTALAALLNNLM